MAYWHDCALFSLLTARSGDAKRLEKSSGNYEKASQSKFSAAPNVVGLIHQISVHAQ
jgi:hypothetical protein